jgi:hypothetical protein
MRLPTLDAKRLGILVSMMGEPFANIGCMGLVLTDELPVLATTLRSPALRLYDKEWGTWREGVPALRIMDRARLYAEPWHLAMNIRAKYIILCGSYWDSIEQGDVDATAVTIVMRAPRVLARFAHPSP